jgi:hypothetical protein
MRVGTDAHALGSSSSGDETYYERLLEHLVRIPTKNSRYVIYYAKPAAAASLVRVRWLPGSTGGEVDKILAGEGIFRARGFIITGTWMAVGDKSTDTGVEDWRP